MGGRARLSGRREILRLRFEEDLTQREIADRVGISQMQCRDFCEGRSSASA
jgi:predicted DNA-binding protein (UPF0251 family)